MTMVSVFFKLPARRITIEEIEEAILATAGRGFIDFPTVGYCEVDAMFEYDGETGIKGSDGFRVYVHISHVADIVETMEQGIGAELLLAWG